TAGSPFSVKVQAFDAYGNLENAGPNAFNEIGRASCRETGSAGCVQSAAFTNGVLASHSLTLTQAGSGALVKVVNHGGTYGTAPSGVSASFTVNPAALYHFSFTLTSSSPLGHQTAGSPFSVKVQAFDAYGNLENAGPNAFN